MILLDIHITGDTLTSFFVMVLILLISGLAKIFYSKASELVKEVKELTLSNVVNTRDVQNIRRDVDNHETRIIKLEDKD